MAVIRFPSTQVRWENLFFNLASDVGLDPSTVGYCLKRLRAEGIAFFTVTLPKLGKHVLYSIEQGHWVQYDEYGNPMLTEVAWKGRSLRYFRSLLGGIFSLKDGKLLPQPDAWCLYAIRQLCEYFYKLTFQFTEKQLKAAEIKYIELEKELSSVNIDRDWAELLRKRWETYFPAISRTSTHDMFTSCRPRFGPGSFSGSDRVRLRGKRIPYWVSKNSSELFGDCRRDLGAFSGFFKPYPSCRSRRPVLAREDKVCEVLFVPKDSRGPRVISREPLLLIKAQMAVFDWLSHRLETATRGRINFKDQRVNQQLAEVSSMTGENVTADMKDASDRVLASLARTVFRNSPALRFALNHLRSTHATLPSGRKIEIRKLAGMGSGLTFPIMSILIFLSVCTAVQLRYRVPFAEIMKRVYVYGDDLIVPKEWWDAAVVGLQKSNFAINFSKTYVNSKFRESCGGDYFDGQNVKPVRLRMFNGGYGQSSEHRFGIEVKRDITGLELERHCRELVSNGLTCTANYLYSRLERILGTLPVVTGGSPILGRYTLLRTDVFASIEEAGLLPEKYYKPVPVIETWDGLCPYKFLGTKLSKDSLIPERIRSSIRLDQALPSGSPKNTFGELVRPRALTLRKGKVFSVELYTADA